MSEEESKVIFEKPIDIPIDNDDDDDEDDQEDNDEEQVQRDETDGQTQAQLNEISNVSVDTLGNVTKDSTNGVSAPTSINENKSGEDEGEPPVKKLKTEDSETNLNNKDKDETPKLDNGKSKKVPLHLLEKRRIGRIKAAEEFAKRLKKIGIEKVESTTLPHSGGFVPLALINQKNYSSDYIRKDEQIFALRERKSLRNNNNPTNTTTVSAASTITNVQPLSPSTSNTPDDVSEVPTATTATTDELKTSASIIDFTAKNDEIDFSDSALTVVIQPGSESVKVGFAMDQQPLIIPNCVAIPTTRYNDPSQIYTPKNKLQEEQPEEFSTLKSQLQSTFKERMRYYKRKIQANSYDQVRGFNSVTRGEPIPDQNDYGRINWIQSPNENDPTIYIGNDALRCTEKNFIHRKPFNSSSNGTILNISDPNYHSIEEVYGDVIRIIKYGVQQLISRRKEILEHPEEIELYTTDQKDAIMIKIDEKTILKCILIIPDMFEKSHVETMIRLLLTELPFNAVALMQESLAACYGSGTGVSTCVVNIGAAETTVSCVDDGSVVENSCVALNYGGNDITRLFAKFLLMSNFPYEKWDTNTVSGWRNAENLKKQCITFQDVDVTTQLFNFIKREPGERTEKIEFKTFDEVMLAPLALFEPKIFKFLKDNDDNVTTNKILREQLPISRDIFTHIPNDWDSLSQDNCKNNKAYCDMPDNVTLINNILDNILENREVEDPSVSEQKLNLTPLDKAIVQSITNAALDIDITKLGSFYSNILIIGGSSKIPALDLMLTDRINIWRPRLLSLNSFGNFYKSLLEKIKVLESNAKSSGSNSTTVNNGPSTPVGGDGDNEDEDSQSNDEPVNKINNQGEESIREQIDVMVKQELEQYIKDTESHTSSEHYLPISVVPAPNDRDPALLLWKGATVLAQLKLIEELYITETDWDVHGNRILQHKCLFAY